MHLHKIWKCEQAWVVMCLAAAAAAKSLQLCLTLCNPTDGSPPGSPIPGILQARTLEWVAISFSNAWKWKVKVKSLSHARLLVTPWTGAHQPPPSMRSSRQEYWSGVPIAKWDQGFKCTIFCGYKNRRWMKPAFYLSYHCPFQHKGRDTHHTPTGSGESPKRF